MLVGLGFFADLVTITFTNFEHLFCICVVVLFFFPCYARTAESPPPFSRSRIDEESLPKFTIVNYERIAARR